MQDRCYELEKMVTSRGDILMECNSYVST